MLSDILIEGRRQRSGINIIKYTLPMTPNNWNVTKITRKHRIQENQKVSPHGTVSKKITGGLN